MWYNYRQRKDVESAICPVCKERVLLRYDKTFSAHLAKLGENKYDLVYCEGTGRKVTKDEPKSL
jgi:hypothetical protein